MNESKVASGKAPLGAFYEVNRLAMLLDMSVRYVKDAVKRGEMEGFLLGNRIVVSAKSVESFLESRRIRSLGVGGKGGQ